MSSFLRIAVLVVLFGLLSASRRAVGDEAADRAQGTALFDEGRKLMGDHKYEEACKRFTAAQKLIGGAGVALNLADCFEKLGKMASAWNEFKHAESLAHEKGQSDKESLARLRATALEPSLSRLTIVVAPNVASIPGITITRNGETVPEAAWGTDVPVDAGTFVIEALASGKTLFSHSVEVTRADSRVSIAIAAVSDAPSTPPIPVESQTPAPSSTGALPTVAVPQPAPVAPPPTAPPPASAHPAPSAPPPLLQPHNAEPLVTSHPAPVQKIFGYILGGAGIAGAGVGAAFAALAVINTNDTKDPAHCGTNNHCDAYGYDLRKTAIKQGWIATGTFIAAASVFTIGIVLVATAPHPPEDHINGLPSTTSRLELHIGPSSVTLGGAF